jgi:hypothetical protein
VGVRVKARARRSPRQRRRESEIEFGPLALPFYAMIRSFRFVSRHFANS